MQPLADCSDDQIARNHLRHLLIQNSSLSAVVRYLATALLSINVIVCIVCYCYFRLLYTSVSCLCLPCILVLKGFQYGSVAITNIWFLLVCSVYCSVLKDLCFTCVTFFFIFCVFISPYISEPANGQFLGMVRNSWGYGVILVSHDWILHFVPLFSGSWGNCPKFC